ncbi:molybdopterin synthase catalytic subunit isoform X1 [Copidosoma floridanum]|uniref:molybdopterin synthase catalytic subunit isoform X1 n=2 Tax=Copidosoma floridanum TaxID=29053 RepID=UPI0006C9A3BC|nr:molybdopterin synthase catalytic subunit isoform X1 [Copidosoma floridanum]
MSIEKPSSAIHVRVLFFAKACELAGARKAELVLPSHSLTFEDLKDRVVYEFNLDSIKDTFVLAHNESVVDEAATLQIAEGDEIAVIPPISGGDTTLFLFTICVDNMEDTKDYVGLYSTKLNFDNIVETVVSPNCGAISTFIGTTRDNFEQKKVLHLEYEAYESMAVKEMQKVCKMIRSKYAVEKIAIYHRLGQVPVTEASIVIAISSPHRQESLQAVQFAIDTVKSVVPIWKKEVYEDDEAQWKENKECLWTKSDIYPKTEQRPKEREENKLEVYNSQMSSVCQNTTDADSVKVKSEPLDYSSDGSLADSERRATISVDYNMCQIKRNTEEMFNRIQAFCLNKKQKASLIKLQENCICSQNLDNHNSDDKTSTCSRVNVIWTKHKSSRNHRDVCRVYNQWSHQNVSPKLKNESNNYPSVLEERISSTEKILGMNKPVPKDVYERLKKIEDRLLLLESTSPEYKNLWAGVMKEKPENSDDDECGGENLKNEDSRKRSFAMADSYSASHEIENRYGKRFR